MIFRIKRKHNKEIERRFPLMAFQCYKSIAHCASTQDCANVSNTWIVRILNEYGDKDYGKLKIIEEIIASLRAKFDTLIPHNK